MQHANGMSCRHAGCKWNAKWHALVHATHKWFGFGRSAGKSTVVEWELSRDFFLEKFQRKVLESGNPSRRAAYQWHATIEK
jgi:hypothetical protein